MSLPNARNIEWTRKDNDDPVTKIKIREMLMESVGANIKVLDAFCGEGKIYEACYKGKVASYHGLDKEKIHDGTLCEKVGDNKKWVSNNSVAPYNFFDLDAYTSAWEIFWIITHSKDFMSTHKRVAFAITDCTTITCKQSKPTSFQKAVMKIPRGMLIPAFHRHLEPFFSITIQSAARDCGAKVSGPVLLQWKPKHAVCYLGFVFEKPSS
jgi:hypothetical protein